MAQRSIARIVMMLAGPRQPGEVLIRLMVSARSARHAEEANRERALALLGAFNLESKAADYAGTLSGGQRKLLELARALMIETRGQLQRGDKVLILGASGGVGTCCVQLAKSIGCEVIACASSDWKLARLKELGADHTINTSTQNYVAEIHRMYGKPRIRGGGGVDVIVNYTGGETWAECFRALKLQGKLLTCGATAGYDPKTDIRYIWSFEFNILGSNGWTVEDQRELLRRVADGRVKPVVHCERPLSEIKIPFKELMDREVFGKAVLIPCSACARAS